MAKRDTGFGNARYTEEEEIFLRQCAALLGLDNSAMVRKALAIALPQLLGNPFCRRVELEDTIEGMDMYVKYMWSRRKHDG